MLVDRNHKLMAGAYTRLPDPQAVAQVRVDGVSKAVRCHNADDDRRPAIGGKPADAELVNDDLGWPGHRLSPATTVA